VSKRTFVCFDCRTTERVDSGRITRNCRRCRRRAEHVYYKFRIPPRRDDGGWDSLMHKARDFNAGLRAVNLRHLRGRRAKFASVLAQLPVSRVAGRRALARRIQELDRQVAEWQTW